MDCCAGGLRVPDLEVGNVRGLSGVMGYLAGDGMVAMAGYRCVRGADAAEHDAGGLEVEDLNEW